MPTGYTHAVQQGTITEFKDFACQCARAFGALVTLRDDTLSPNIPDEIPADGYYAKALAEAEKELAALDAASDEDIIRMATEHNTKERAGWLSRRDERDAQRGRYLAMLEKAKAWTPPSPDHVGLKDFMVNQLSESVRFDCGEANERYDPEPAALSPTDWLNARREELKKQLARAQEGHAEEVARAAKRTEWIRQLKQSLEEGSGAAHSGRVED